MFQRFFDEGLAQASFLLACPRTREAVIIDPRRDVDVYVETARAHGLRIAYAFETHVHADFACGSRELAAVGAKTIAGPGANLRYAHHEATHGERLRVGDISIEFMHTPGHTPEHLSILASQPDQPARLFTGDTLFVGAVGRPDLLGEEQTRRLAGELLRLAVQEAAGARRPDPGASRARRRIAVRRRHRQRAVHDHRPGEALQPDAAAQDEGGVRRRGARRPARHAALLPADEEAEPGRAAAARHGERLPRSGADLAGVSRNGDPERRAADRSARRAALSPPRTRSAR